MKRNSYNYLYGIIVYFQFIGTVFLCIDYFIVLMSPNSVQFVTSAIPNEKRTFPLLFFVCLFQLYSTTALMFTISINAAGLWSIHTLFMGWAVGKIQ
jgi:hypothetical protein